MTSAEDPDVRTAPLEAARRAAAPRSVRRIRELSLVGAALALSAVGVFLASRFERPPPPPPLRPEGVQVASGAVSIASGAPQWDVIRLGKAEQAHDHWSDPVPGYVRVDEAQASRVGAPLGGRVQQVFAELGQTVAVGTPLFSVASPDLAAMRAEQDRARVDLAAAKQTYDRIHAIVQSRALPEKDELAAAQALKQAELTFAAATSRLASLKVTPKGYGEFTVRAPCAGQVAEKSVLPGQEIDAGAQGNLMMIADLSRVWVVAELFEADLVGIGPGTKARITVPSLPGRSFEATVESMSAVVDPERHSLPVRVELPNPDHLLRPNTYARMQFFAAAPPGSVTVPSSSLITDGSTQYVYVQDQPGKLSRRRVTAGAAREGSVIVTEGLAPGEMVVERGAILLDNQVFLSE